jgi:hypothetical protein
MVVFFVGGIEGENLGQDVIIFCQIVILNLIGFLFIQTSVFNLTETQPETRVFSKNPTQT